MNLMGALMYLNSRVISRHSTDEGAQCFAKSKAFVTPFQPYSRALVFVNHAELQWLMIEVQQLGVEGDIGKGAVLIYFFSLIDANVGMKFNDS